MQQCPKQSLMTSMSFPRLKWPYLAHFLNNSCHFRYKWQPKVTPLSQTVPKGIILPLNGNMVISSPFFDRFSSRMVLNDITQSSWRNLPNLAHLLINSWHFGYKWPPKVTPSFQTIPKGITQPLNGNMAISGPFLTNSHQFWFKWYSNDIASSRMVLDEITQPLVKELTISSPFLN